MNLRKPENQAAKVCGDDAIAPLGSDDIARISGGGYGLAMMEMSAAFVAGLILKAL